MSKNERVAAMVRRFEGRGVEPHYAAYFELFNEQLFYEAHDALEQLWLPVRRTPEGAFYKGLIQLAGAFVHLQKNRSQSATALFRLARTNLAPFGPSREGLNVAVVVEMIDDRLASLEAGETPENLLTTAPKLSFQG